MSEVYIQVNNNNYIINIDSDEFITDFTNWIKIDEGIGDKYRLAQQHYLDRPLSFDGNYNYKYINGEIVEVDITSFIRRKEIMNEINIYKQKLNETDYKAIKYAEGVLTEDYEPIKQQRQQWRDKINELESELI